MNDPVINKIEHVLISEYSVKDYVELVQEVFSNVKLIAPDRQRKEFTNFSTHIYGSSHVGEYTTSDDKKVLIFAVQLQNQSFVENSRSTQRSYAKKLIENSGADAALVAFYTVGDPKWRLSFVRLDYEIKFENGKLKTAENITPAKRYSYLVGKGEPCHTAISQFRKFISVGAGATLDDLEEAFSVETVTNEFFALYCEKFHQLVEHLEANEDFQIESAQHNFDAPQFAKKLMGQIVFLYFLQKKGWLGVNAWPKIMSEKDYKSAFYARGSKSRELIPELYKLGQDGVYHLLAANLRKISDEDEALLAPCVKGEPWGTGPHDFMRRLFQFSEKRNANFFDDYLEPLFYNALNVNRGEQGYDPILKCRIPFLSGGLFEPIDGYEWEHNNFGLPNSIFSNRQADNSRTGDGILDIFDRYNFTMSEDEPLEKEVAIDPEMLGKVFENLLEIKDRKSKGAFYTPREIVHYMCQESLINYLKDTLQIEETAVRDFILYGDFMKDEDTVKEKRAGNGGMLIDESLYLLDKDGKVIVNRLLDMDQALANVRIADPAVGSGAFPLGMLNEIVRARQNISAYLAITMNSYDKHMMYQMERSPHSLKYETIKNCIFAVDIEPSAVDIARLRLWLALVIDDETNPNAQSPLDGHRNPLPLPNLECNVLCGNSLVDEFEGIKLINESDLLGNLSDISQLNLNAVRFDSTLMQMLDKQNELYGCKDTAVKHQLIDEIRSLRDMIIRDQLVGCSPEQIQRYQGTTQMASKPYILWQLDFAKVFREKGGFDIIIGNPPYIGEEGHKELFQEIAQTAFGHQYYMGKMDFWYFFVSKGMNLLKPNGCLSYIAPNNWMTTAGGKKMREHIATQGRIKQFITFNNVMIFESASQQTMIFLLEKSVQKKIYSIKYKAVGNISLGSNDLRKFLRSNTIGTQYDAKYNPVVNSDGRTIQFLDFKITSITDKISNNGDIFLNSDEILNGIHPHHASVTKKMLEKLPNASIGDGIFVLSNREIDDLNLDVHEQILLKPYYDTHNIGRYYFNSQYTSQIIYTTSDFKNVSLMDNYPILKKHLDKYVDVITSDNRPYGLHRARKQEFFESPKICALRKCKTPTFAYIDVPAYVTAEWYVIMTNRLNMKYLTSLLNSNIIKFWLLYMGKMQGNIFQIDKEPLLKIPILKPTSELESKICHLYANIISEFKSDPKAKHVPSEKETNALFYSAYGITNLEAEYIERCLCEWDS